VENNLGTFASLGWVGISLRQLSNLADKQQWLAPSHVAAQVHGWMVHAPRT